jgi:aminotransferase
MRERTVVVNSLSKTYSVTGWRVGYCIAPPHLTSAIRKVHDFLTVGAAAPLQAAGAAAMALPPSYYAQEATRYRERRDLLCSVLAEAGFTFRVPDGAYYVLCETGDLDPGRDSSAFARRIVVDPGIAAVPGTSFYADPSQGAGQIRFAFPKKLDTLRAAAERIAQLR